MHSPPSHVSLCVHALPSLQELPSGWTLCTRQPVIGSRVGSFWSATQVPVWQPPCRHTLGTGVLTHPSTGSQLSTVQVKPSLHSPIGCRQPCCGSQMSSVQALLSSQ